MLGIEIMSTSDSWFSLTGVEAKGLGTVCRRGVSVLLRCAENRSQQKRSAARE